MKRALFAFALIRRWMMASRILCVHGVSPLSKRTAWTTPRIACRDFFPQRLFGSNQNEGNPDNTEERLHVAIVGGGLAGLSVAHHLLVDGNKDNIQMTIFDVKSVGKGGASSVAGGLLHPFSPSAKLAHWGMEGLACTNELVGQYASVYQPDCVLRNELYRVASTPQQEQQLRETSTKFPDHCTWQSPGEIQNATDVMDSMGGIKLHCGKVLDVPLYLQGLWESCVHLSHGAAQWTVVPRNDNDWKTRLQDYNVVVLCAGAGMFVKDEASILHNSFREALPIQLVRGQSAIMSVPPSRSLKHAVLCGKYMTPTLEPNRVLVGATHEFQQEPWTPDKVQQELQQRCVAAPYWFWEQAQMAKTTSGFRVQSHRGKYGRLPLIGKLDSDSTTLPDKENLWIFTGLSARGLLYHGIYGKILASSILRNKTDPIDGGKQGYDHLNWWRDKLPR